MYSLARSSNVGASRSARRSPTGSAPCTTVASASFAFERASVSGTRGYVPSVNQRDRPRTLYFTTQERDPPAASRRPNRGSPPSHTTRWPLSGSTSERMIESLSFLGMFGSSSRQLPHSYPAGPNKHGSYRTSANEEVSENTEDAALTPRRSSTSVTTENHGVGGSTPPLATCPRASSSTCTSMACTSTVTATSESSARRSRARSERVWQGNAAHVGA